ncbi:MAG TPA: hypothetical protein V6D11_01010 [Waterburya sp.]
MDATRYLSQYDNGKASLLQGPRATIARLNTGQNPPCMKKSFAYSCGELMALAVLVQPAQVRLCVSDSVLFWKLAPCN